MLKNSAMKKEKARPNGGAFAVWGLVRRLIFASAALISLPERLSLDKRLRLSLAAWPI
jgi:hypothetical protein